MRSFSFYPHGKDMLSIEVPEDSSVRKMLEAILEKYPKKSRRNPAPAAAHCYINDKAVVVSSAEQREAVLDMVPSADHKVVFIQDCAGDAFYWKSFWIIPEAVATDEPEPAEV